MDLLDLEITFGYDKMQRVLNRPVFNKYKNSNAEDVALAYITNKTVTSKTLSTLDLLTLAVAGNLKYSKEVTKEMLITMSNRFLRSYIWTYRTPKENKFSEEDIQNFQKFQDFVFKKILQL